MLFKWFGDFCDWEKIRHKKSSSHRPLLKETYNVVIIHHYAKTNYYCKSLKTFCCEEFACEIAYEPACATIFCLLKLEDSAA